MNNFFRPKGNMLMISVVVWCLGISLLCTGCESLRKKFTRQKKKEDAASEKFIPVLEPEEYPSKEHNPLAAYKYHYDLYKVWHRDLEATIEDNMTDKRQKYSYKNLLKHVTAMEQLLSGPRQEGLTALRRQLEKMGPEFEKPAVMRNFSSVSNQLRLIGKEIRKNYQPQDIEGIFPQHP